MSGGLSRTDNMPETPATTSDMIPVSPLDVFILTFNAGKAPIDPSIFAYHLGNAFSENATDLPDLVVFCLQEMAPLANSFIGSYMISPFFQGYAAAVNIAASNSVQSQKNPDQRQYADGSQDSLYTLIASRNVGMTGIMLFARDPTAVHDLQSTEVGFGAGSMANKGAVGLRLLFERKNAGQKRSTELTFVSTHLAAQEWNLARRNRDWQSIVTGLLFQDPSKLHGSKAMNPTGHTLKNGDETEALLSEERTEKTLHDITIYKPGTQLFVGGDLNYRLSKTSPTSSSVFPDLNPQSPNHFRHFLVWDQLNIEKTAGRTLHGLTEAPIRFPPTYKLDMVDEDEALDRPHDESALHVVPWKWASHRWPGWCDRILYLDTPIWAMNPENRIINVAYNALPPVRTSDHRAVFLRLAVPVVEPAALMPPKEARSSYPKDPRVKLPYPVDFQAWEHRAQVKKWEPLIGWSMLISQSKKGIAFFVTLFLIGLGTWWLRSR